MLARLRPPRMNDEGLHVAAGGLPAGQDGRLADVVAPCRRRWCPGADAPAAAGYPAIADAVPPEDRCRHGPVRRGRMRLLPRAGMPRARAGLRVDAPWLYRRPATPTRTDGGEDWPDNLQRFALLGWVAPTWRRRARPAGSLRWCTRTTGTRPWPAPPRHPASGALGIHDPQPRLPGPVPRTHGFAELGLPLALHAPTAWSSTASCRS